MSGLKKKKNIVRSLYVNEYNQPVIDIINRRIEKGNEKSFAEFAWKAFIYYLVNKCKDTQAILLFEKNNEL